MNASTSAPALGDDPHSYLIDCHACGATYDAMTATWCQCIVKERSLLCSNCGHCFCRADLEYKRKVWTSAPDALWERKQRHARDHAILPENPPVESVSRPLVLVVDDDREIRALTVHLVSGWDWGCIHAPNGTDGLALARLYRPDLILTDALMPKMDGRELCRLVKADPELGNTRVIVMSSVYTSGRFKREALSHFKADEYLAKPIEPAQLYRLVTTRDVPTTAAASEWVPPASAIEEPALLHLDASNDTLSIAAIVDASLGDAETPAADPTTPPLEPRLAASDTPGNRLRLTAKELIRLRALGLDTSLASATADLPGLRAVDLVAIRTAGVPLEFVRAIDPQVRATLATSELITLHSTGCDPAAINVLGRYEFDATEIVSLIAAGVTLSFVSDVLAIAARPLSVTDLVRLNACDVPLDYIREMAEQVVAVDDWIRFWTLGVPPEFVRAAGDAFRESCTNEDLLQLWLSGADVMLLRQVRDGI